MCIRFSRCGLTSRGAASLGEMLQHNNHLTSLGYGKTFAQPCSIIGNIVIVQYWFDKIGDNGVKMSCSGSGY